MMTGIEIAEIAFIILWGAVMLYPYRKRARAVPMVVLPDGLEVVRQYEMDKLLERQCRARITWSRMSRDNVAMQVRRLDYVLCHCAGMLP